MTRTASAGQAKNAAKAVPVPAAAAAPSRGASAFTSARNAGMPASAPVAAQKPAVQAAAPAARPAGAVAVRAAEARNARAERRRMASVRRLAARSRTVALTRDVPDQKVARPAEVAVAAPTGSIQGMVTAAAQRAGVSPSLGHAVVKVESMYQPRATGKGGYIGLMQLSYQTAKGMGFRGSRQALYEPSNNLQYGMRYLAEAVRKSGGNTCAAVSKYQGGHAVKGVTRAGAVYCAKVKRYMAAG